MNSSFITELISQVSKLQMVFAREHRIVRSGVHTGSDNFELNSPI